MKLSTCIDNYINGNLSDAKAQAKRLSKVSLYRSMRRTYGWDHARAFTAATYLKEPSQATFDAACAVS
jgi:hypothetical protein